MHFIRALVLWCFFPKGTSNAPVFLDMSLSGRSCGKDTYQKGPPRTPQPWKAASAVVDPRLPLSPAVRPCGSSIQVCVHGDSAPSRAPQVCAHRVSIRTAGRPGFAAARCSKGLSLWSYIVEVTALGSEDRRASRQAGVCMRWAVRPGAPWGESGTPVWVPGHPPCGPQASAGHQEAPDMALLKEHM